MTGSLEGPPFSFDARVDGARVVVTLTGEIDAYTARALRDGFAGLGDVGGRHVVVELAGVGFVDSAGLSAIVVCLRQVRDAGGALSLRGMSPQLTKLFEITGVSRLFPAE